MNAITAAAAQGLPRFDDVDAFLAWAADQPGRWELHDGVPRPRHVWSGEPEMTSGSVRHQILCARVCVALARSLPPPLEAIVEPNVREPATGRLLIPDVAVWRSAPIGADLVLPDPVLVVEVASPASSGDLEIKAARWRAVPSVAEIVVLRQDVRRLSHMVRSGDHWRLRDHVGAGVVALACGGAIDLAELHRGLAVEGEAGA